MTPTPLTVAKLKEHPLPTPREGSKDDRGSALILGGSASVPGAALLASVAALRAGAGKLKIATAQSAAVGMALTVPEAMVVGLPETSDGGIDGERALECLRTAAEGCDALLVGPGLLGSKPTTAMAVELLHRLPTATFILDAAAICALASHADDVRRHKGRVVITPHAGEMAQLLDRSRDAVEADPLDAALTAADLLQVVVVMKGARTWIVDPQGARWLYEGGGVGLATSGSGDALAGIVVGLLARGVEPLSAALWGVYLHGEAGRRLAASVGPIGFLARELSGEVPRILHEASD
ncbi:yjeF C-terminal region, hydroxyethylthiazole kinase-related [Methylobacterium phyllostachyos]|uniref:ADP-dependent (S)-NAD(P)H-hydrate dehydratase n=1 Tax=Methylobacterium phyllostachyos TaxID=582672 RepID=A0A1H0KQ41_9HYPH|nr:NAD(P)H-hydrate dehydratase [Methylobacterium phyllostachyos]SDO57916.1 yjeF C-terminal region, hydroxyethylthiazole kinase-related [Methylobacterium phyllostachyos]